MKHLMTVLAIIVLISAGVCAQEPVLLHPCDDIEGASLSSGSGLPNAVIDIATDADNLTQGNGSIHISAESTPEDTGNTYLAVDLPIEPTSFEDKKLIFDAWTSDPDISRALYVRGYDADGNCVLSWLNWDSALDTEPTTYELMIGWSQQLAWEEKMVEVDTATPVVKLRFYVGTHRDGVTFDMYVDNIRTVEHQMQMFEDVSDAKMLYPTTTLVESGEPRAAIVHPSEDGWAAIAADAADAIEQATGARLSVKPADETTDEELQEINAVIIGNIANNRRLLYPYSHNLTFADGIYPGDGGYEVRSVHDPWGTGHNIIAIGASDIAGAQAGVEYFKGLLAEGETLVLDSFSETKLEGIAASRLSGSFRTDPDEKWLEAQQKNAEARLDSGIHGGLFSIARSVGRNYALTRKPGYAKHFAWLIKRAHEHYLTDPQTYGGPWGMDSDFTIYSVIPAWDAVEECPELTAQERLEVTKILFKWVSEVAPRKAARASSSRVRFNHQTFPGLGLLYSGQYFSRYYDVVEGEHWIDLADGCFQFQMDAKKAHCDCNGYQWLTDSHTLNYALARPDFRIFENGNARFLADYAIQTMNNLGYQVPYGDMHGWGSIGAELRVLQAAEWYYRDGTYQWALEKKYDRSSRYSVGTFSVNTEPRVPEDQLGATVWPLGDDWYRSFEGSDHVAREKAFDKVIYRNGFEPEDQYMLLDGLSRGGHGHYDGNSILQWSENGRIWLGEPETTRFSSAPKIHNTVLVLKDGQSQRFPAYSSMENFADLSDFTACRMRVSDYAGANWDRWALWLKDDAFVVIDRVTAQKAGDFSVRALWHMVGDVTIDGTSLDIEQQGQYARVAMSPETRCLLSDDEKNASTWRSYPYVDDSTPHALQGVINRQLEPGEHVTLFTVLHASGEEPSEASIQSLGENMAVVSGFGDPMLVMLPGTEGTIAVPGAAQSEADLLVLSPEKAYGANVRQMAFEGQATEFPEGADIEFDISSGEARAKEPARMATDVAQEVTVADLEARADAEELRAMIENIVMMAPPSPGGAQVAAEAPELAAEWKYADVPDQLLLSGNRGLFGAVDAGMEVSCEPQPLEANVFSQVPGQNTIDAINDGTFESTSDSVMWAEDETVTLNIEFDQDVTISDIILKAWFATSSSKGKIFQLDTLKVLASSDGFADDIRTIVDFDDNEMHGNWGAPGHAPHDYEFENIDATAKSLRMVLTPRDETGIYIAELMIWGEAEGLEAVPMSGGQAVETFRALHAADIDGDGSDEIVAGSKGGKVYCLEDGTVRWTFDAHTSVESVNVANLDGEGTPAVIAGGLQSTLYTLTPGGEKLWEYELPQYKRTPNIRTVFPADLDGDGEDEVIAGADSWRYYAFDGDGTKLWQYETIHASTVGTATDMDGDDADEVIAATEYYLWHCIDGDGSGIWRYHSRSGSGPHCNALDTGDINGDGTPEVVFAGADANVHVVSEGKLMWAFNTGDEVTGVAVQNVQGDDTPEILATSLSFNAYCLDAEGNVIWRTDVMTPIVDMTFMRSDDADYLAVGCSDGAIYLLNADDGEIAARFQARGEILAMTTATVEGQELLIASSTDGYAYAITAPQ